jgi:uncharacterized protein YdeI (BOF family)
MKKFVAILLLALTASTAMAQHHGYRYQPRSHYHGHGGWVAPLIIGGTIGYALSRPAPVVVEQPPVYVQPQPPVVQQQCTRYIYQDQNGQTIREEIRCSQ